MDEAQALCDRVAMMHQGRCVALDTPDVLVDRLDASYRVRFAAPSPFDPDRLQVTDGVERVNVTDGRVEVRGGNDLLTTVVRHLADQNVTPNDLHAERATLEDVFLTLTDERSASSLHTPNTAPPAKQKPS
jgi:ABC-2 type transport system ATP-binding protein